MGWASGLFGVFVNQDENDMQVSMRLNVLFKNKIRATRASLTGGLSINGALISPAHDGPFLVLRPGVILQRQYYSQNPPTMNLDILTSIGSYTIVYHHCISSLFPVKTMTYKVQQGQ